MKSIKTTLILLFFSCSLALSAQPAPPNPGGGGSPTPFGFVELLMGAGAALGGYKAYKSKKKKSI